MSDSIPPNTTAYEIPLTDKQLIALGRITAAWAQVEFFVDRLLMLTKDLGPREFDTAYAGKMVGTRIDDLDLEAKRLGEGRQSEALVAFVLAALAIKNDRNHTAHGLWGFRISGQKTFVAARHRKSPGTPFRAERLKGLEAKVARTSILGAYAIDVFLNTRLIVPARLHFGAAEQPPAWLGKSRLIGRESHPTRGRN